MIGKFIVIQGCFRDRYIVREVLGETAKMWSVRNPRTLDVNRVHKSSNPILARCEDVEAAQDIATKITSALIGLRDTYTDERAAILLRFNREGTDT